MAMVYEWVSHIFLEFNANQIVGTYLDLSFKEGEHPPFNEHSYGIHGPSIDDLTIYKA